MKVLLIHHTWYVSYQDKPIPMAGVFTSLAAFEQSRKTWLMRPEVTSISIDHTEYIKWPFPFNGANVL